LFLERHPTAPRSGRCHNPDIRVFAIVDVKGYLPLVWRDSKQANRGVSFSLSAALRSKRAISSSACDNEAGPYQRSCVGKAVVRRSVPSSRLGPSHAFDDGNGATSCLHRRNVERHGEQHTTDAYTMWPVGT
jgi:hypothetical protein